MRTRRLSIRQQPPPALRLSPGSSVHGTPPKSANDRFKKTFWPTFRVTVLVAVAAHFTFFELFPHLEVTNVAVASEAMAAFDLPPEVTIPPPPEQIARPATPRVAAVQVDEDITIAPTTFEQNPVESLGPPPAVVTREADRPAFIPYTVAPRLLNKEEMLVLLQRVYPPELRSAGIGGTVRLWVYVDESGAVQDARVADSSGYERLDAAAKTLAPLMRFSPAMNRDRLTPVWINQPVSFEVVN